MELFIKKEDCCGCHACYNVCPVNAIDMNYDPEGFLYPNFLNDKCINCNKCKMVCPIVNKPKVQPLKEVYACKAKLEKERMSSTSGGVFATIARAVLSKDGIICGAAFDENQEVYHLVANDNNGLQLIKGTKYVQSRIGDVYKELKNHLEENKLVLFSGTPCQVAGFKSYLCKEYDNLLCVDLICHGVPSPKVWKKYLEEISEGRKIKNVIFRNKHEYSNITTIDYFFENGDLKSEAYTESLYTKGFIKNLYVRPSCFNCQFKGLLRCSDITLGDFWSIREFHLEFSDDYGISAVIVHSEKGMNWLKKVSDKLEMISAKEKEVSYWNDCLLKSTQENPYRELFFEKWNQNSVMGVIEDLIKKTQNFELESTKNTLVSKIKNYIKRKFIID